MFHHPIHPSSEFWDRTFGLPCVYLGKLAKGPHLAIQHVISTLHIFDEFTGIDVRIATIGKVVNNFRRNEDGSDRGSGRVGGVVRREVGECRERVRKFDAVGLDSSVENL